VADNRREALKFRVGLLQPFDLFKRNLQLGISVQLPVALNRATFPLSPCQVLHHAPRSLLGCIGHGSFYGASRVSIIQINAKTLPPMINTFTVIAAELANEYRRGA
jgi:hypothetical protein